MKKADVVLYCVELNACFAQPDVLPTVCLHCGHPICQEAMKERCNYSQQELFTVEELRECARAGDAKRVHF